MINVDKGSPVSESFDLFMQAATLTQKYADSRFYKGAGISAIKYTVLKILANAENPVTPSELSRRTLRVRHDITTLIGRMKRDGLVNVIPNAIDKRSVIILLTEKGRDKLVQAEPVAEEIANQVMSQINKTNMASMTRTLNTLKQNAIDGDDKISKTFRKQR